MGNDKVVDIFLYLFGVINVLYGLVLWDIRRCIKQNKEDIDNELKLKQDAAVCLEIKKGFIADMSRGEKKFQELIHELKEHTKAFNSLQVSITQVVVRLEVLERRRFHNLPAVHPMRREEDIHPEDDTLIGGCV